MYYFGSAGAVGFLLLLNLAGVWKTVFGLDTAAILTVVAEGISPGDEVLSGTLNQTGLLRTLESYKKILDDKTTAILSSDSELMKMLMRGANAQ